MLAKALQYLDTVDFVQGLETEDPQLAAEPVRGFETTVSQWERVDEDPPPSFSLPTHEYTYRQMKRDLRMWTGGSCDYDGVMRALVRLDDLEIRPGTSGQNGKTIPRYFTDPEVHATTIVQALRVANALGTSLSAVIKGYATVRDAKLAESSYDKVVMWTGGSYDDDDVVRALVRLDRPEMRPGTNGQSGETVPTYFTDPEVDARTIAPGSESWTQQSFNGPHWNEAVNAMLEDADFCKDGETTIARNGAVAIPGGCYIADDGQEEIEEDEVPQMLLQAPPVFRHPWYRALREELNVAQKSQGFFGPRRSASGRDQGPRMKRSSIQQLKLRTRCARCRKLGHWALECPEGTRGQRNDERYDRRALRPEENPKGFITVAMPIERKPFFLGASWTFVTLDPGEVLWDTGAQEGLTGKHQLDKWCKLLAKHGLQVEWSQEKPESASGIGRRDATNRCCICASWFPLVQWHHSVHCCGAGCPTSTIGGNNEDTPS